MAALIQIGGVLVLVADVPAASSGGDLHAATIGYVVMRVGLMSQWIRVALRLADRARLGSGNYVVLASAAALSAGFDLQRREPAARQGGQRQQRPAHPVAPAQICTAALTTIPVPAFAGATWLLMRPLRDRTT